MNKLKEIIDSLVNAQALPVRNRDHPLKGTLKDCRECHIEGDWLLIYRIDGSELCLTLKSQMSIIQNPVNVAARRGTDSTGKTEMLLSRGYS
jgi:addiction module RelE/StbE family toxin